MSQLRTSIALPRFEAAQAVAAGRIAERWAVRTLWLGEAGVDPTYVAAAAGAVAATTKALRIGLFIDLDCSASPLRVAEDVAVLDNLSGGRIELGLLASGEEEWAERAGRLLDAWEHGWPVPDRNPLAIIPQPIQPLIPRLVVGDPGAEDFLQLHGAGRLFIGGGDKPPPRIVGERRVLLIGLAELASEEDAIGRLTGLRAAASGLGASEIMIEADFESFETTAREVGRLIDPAMRCTLDDIPAIVQDVWQYREQSGE
jgi:hypothetical protein